MPMRMLLLFLLASLYAGISLADPVVIDGTLTVMHEDYADGHAVYRHFLDDSKGKRHELHFKKMPTKPLTGDKVRVKGNRKDDKNIDVDDLQVLPSGGSLTTLQSSSIVPYTFGVQHVAVILVNFTDEQVQTNTIADVQDKVFNQISNWDLARSYGQTWLTGDVFGWFTISVLSTVCDTSGISTQGDAAATRAGAVLSNYNRKVYIFPGNACTWSGLGTVGGNPSQAWIKGGISSPQVTTHEMGHNFGLYHSHSLDCPYAPGWPPIANPLTTYGCSVTEYGDQLDTMGVAQPWGPFNSAQKERLGWLNYGTSPPIRTASVSGTYSIDAYEPATTNPHALKVPGGEAGHYYYLEMQPGVLAYPGVIVHYASDTDGTSIDLLNMNGGQYKNWSLDVGQTFVDPFTGVSITTVAANSTNATVSVLFPGGTLPPPVLSLTAS